MCIIKNCPFTLAGRSEGSGVDRCIPGGHHVGWALGSYRPISAAAGRDLHYHKWLRPGRAAQPMGVSYDMTDRYRNA